MKRILIAPPAATCLAVVLAGCSARAIPEAPPPAVTVAADRYRSAVDASRAALAPLLAKYPAVSAAVAIDGRPVWVETSGWADVDARRPATPSTRFRIYSNSKPITAALALRLAERKVVDLDAPIATHLTDLPPAL